MGINMALNIANPNVEEKAVKASNLLGVNKTAAVEIALEYYLEHHQTRQQNSTTREEVARLLDELIALPVLDNRDADEILGYDQYGLP